MDLIDKAKELIASLTQNRNSSSSVKISIKISTTEPDYGDLSIEELEILLAEREDQLSLLQSEEPEDDSSDEYEEWEDSVDELEGEIEEIQDAIDERYEEDSE